MNQLAPGEGGPHDPGMDARVSRLEEEVGEVRAILHRIEPMIVRIDAQIPYLATQAELEKLRGEVARDISDLRGDVAREISNLRGEAGREFASLRGDVMAALETKPSRSAMWTMGIALFGLVVAAMATGAACLPFLAERLNFLK